MPPQDILAEKCVIGCALLNAESIDETGNLRAEQFYHDGHAAIWQTVLAMHGEAQFVDAVTVSERMDREGTLREAGGAELLADCLRTVPHAAHAGYYAGVVRDRWAKRQVIYAATQCLRQTYESAAMTGEEVVAEAQARLSELESQLIRLNDSDIGSLMLDLMREMQAGDTDPGIPTGYSQLDELIVGLRPGNLIVIAARPSCGKTALALNLSLNMAEAGHGVAFMSLEQSTREVADRLLLCQSAVDGHRYRANELYDHEREALIERANKLDRLNIYVDESNERTAPQLASSLRSIQRRRGVKCCIIDYLQLIDPENRRIPREQQVAAMTRQLKRMAKQQHVPVIVLAQLNREIERRNKEDGSTVPKPRMSDLRESGSIEQDADIVMFLDRPSLWVSGGDETMAKLYVKKHRNGKTGEVKLNWEDSTMTFRNRAADYQSLGDF